MSLKSFEEKLIFEQLGAEESVCAHGRGLKLDGLWDPLQSKAFYDFIIENKAKQMNLSSKLHHR